MYMKIAQMICFCVMRTSATNARSEINGAIASRMRLVLRRGKSINFCCFCRGGLAQNKCKETSKTQQRWATNVVAPQMTTRTAVFINS